jgi:autotransporter-associated beta strand protein
MKPNLSRSTQAFLLLLGSCLCLPICAAPVAVGDSSFEGNSLGPGGYAYDLAPEWTGTNGSNNGSAFEEYITGFSADGTDHLGMENNYEVWQDVGTYLADTAYTLTVAVGHRSGLTQSGNLSQYQLADSDGIVYATGSFDASTLSPQTFADAPALVFTTPANPAAIGKTLRIRLRSGGNGRSHFDHIRLDASPTTIPGSATVGDLAATNLSSSTATLNGAVSAIGNDAPAITFFWGTTNGNADPANWDHSLTLPGTHSGGFSAGISSLSPATRYFFTARATNSAGNSWALPSATFETLAAPPAVATTSATEILATTARLGADVTDTGGENPVVTIYYGTTDGGTTLGAWAHSALAGTGAGPLSVPVAGLDPLTTYFFRAFAANSGGTAWAASSASFTTISVTAPVVENRDPEGITGTTANLRGEVTATGNDVPTVTLFYGTSDGGTDPAAWSTSANQGLQSGDFSRFVLNLSPQTTYFFRWRAVNSAGSSWSAESGTFTTTALVPSGVVINEFHYNSLDNTSFEEFIELHNPGDSPVDVSGWTLSDAISFTIPQSTTIPVGGYLVVAQNPAVLQSKYQVAGALGPWTGALSAKGERIDLRDTSGALKDRVDFGVGFPWPTAADGAGSSCELVHPSLDNDLGGSWRSSGAFAVIPTTYIASLSTGWKYKKGTAEASSPIDAWRAVAYDDSTWLTGQAAIGYGDSNVVTTLNDMRNRFNTPGYASVYFRKSFTVPTGNIPRTLKLRVRIDDGCVIWINGTEVDRRYVGTGNLAYNYLAPANHDNTNWDEVIINNADTFLFGGTNVIAVHGFNTALNSGDFSMDLELSSNDNSSPLPTPGRVNSVHRPIQLVHPQIRQVAHTPKQPIPNQPVAITARITDPDGMGAVSLAYQLVDPGNYIRLSDAAYQTAWTTVPMSDTGTNGDAVAGDSTFTAVLPGTLQTHRRLVRYRISFADSLGNAQTVPYADDEQPNFAYFVYGGVPSWTGAMRPVSYNGFPATPAQTYPSAMLESMPPLHLVANATDVANCQYNGNFSNTRFRGTVIQRGVVHDHIEFRVRGIGSTYQSGKNKWNIYFNRSRDYQGYDNFGKPYKETWNNLLVNANASPWASVHRGSGGVEEAVSHRIYQLAGMAAMNTQFFHFRVIDDAQESSPTDQYSGDLWGLYLGLEPTEGNFLDERGLADGNVYSIEGNGGDKKHQGPTQPVDSSDWNAFRSALETAGQTEQWYRDNVDLPTLYTFLALNRLIGNVDVRPGDNYRFYHRPTDNRWVIFPYDMDMQFIAAHHWGGSMDGVVVAGAPNVIRAISRHPNLAREYRNRCRELLSLMASDGSASGGQIGQLIGEYARFIHPTGETLTWANLDAAMWNLHPRTAGGGANTGQSSHKGNFFRANYLDGGRGGLGGTSSTGSWVRTLTDSDADGFSDHPGLMQWFVNFSTNTWPGGTWNRKAMSGIGGGTDSDPNRQLGYGYKYLEFEALHGGWIDCNANPVTAPFTDYPVKPVVTHTGAPGFPVHDLEFTSSAFSDPQGAGTYAAHEWRLAEIYAPGIPGYVAGSPCKYEIETVWSSGEVTGAPGAIPIPLGIAEPGKTYRVRVRHKDTTGNWSYWSDPVEFGATAAPPGALIHYWNFNDTANLLVPTQTIGGGAIAVAGTYLSGTGQDFAGLNARNGDPAGAHLRVNDPLTAGTMVTVSIPTGGFENIIVKYETRRSGQGAGLQNVSYTLDGSTFTPFASFTIPDAAPVVQTLDFRSVTGAGNNPLFGIQITFTQGDGGTSGNNRFDNLTVEADALPGQPELLPGGDTDWNVASNWASASVPNGTGALAIVGPPAAGNRAVTLTAPVTIGTLEMDNADSAFLNEIKGNAGITLSFNGGTSTALLDVDGTGSGHIAFDIPGGTSLATDLRLDVSNIGGDPAHGALRLRETWDGPGGLIKQGPGTASLTGIGKTFSGAVVIEEGVLQVSQPSTPTQTAGVSVHPGGQLRLTSGNDLNGERIHSFGGAISLAGSGRGASIPDTASHGVQGALRYAPDVPGANRAVITNPVTLAADATIHTTGPDNTLALSGTIGGSGKLTKSGEGALVLSGASPAFAGPVENTSGLLEVNGSISGAPVQLAAGSVLTGSGTTGPLTGTGTVAPHLSTLTAPSTAAAGYEFVLENTAIAANSVLRLTDSNPLPGAPQNVDLFVNIPSRLPGDRIHGGFFTPSGFDLAAALATAQVRLLVPDPAGPIAHRGVNYRTATPDDHLTWSVVDLSHDFGSGAVSGRTLQIAVGGTPSQYTQWRNLFFPNPADATNDAVSGPNANPSGDGIANLIRYAHGVGPFDPVIHLLPVLVRNGDSFDFRFRYDAAKTDLTWRVNATNDLNDWSAILFDSSVGPVPPLEDGWLPVALPDHLGAGPAADPDMFIRLEVRIAQP